MSSTKKLFFAVALYLITSFSPFGGKTGFCQLAVNGSGAAPDPSAQLDVVSTSKGLLLPRLDSAQIAAISAPIASLLIYNTTDSCFEARLRGTWVKFWCEHPCALPLTPGSISGASSATPGQTGVAYSVGAVSGANGYVWIYSGTGLSITAGANTDSITVSFSGSATSGTLIVYGKNSCGVGAGSASFAITL
jgi:hypothetical protein